MLYKYILYFLGLYAWSYKPSTWFEKLILKKNVNLKLLEPLKNNKKFVVLSETSSNSPSIYPINDDFTGINITLLKFLDKETKIKIILYNIYSLCIFIILCIQPLYLFINMCKNHNNNIEEYLLLFLLNINIPINYAWAKYYYSTQHFEIFSHSCNVSCTSYIIIIILLTFISIFISFIDINTFYNEYYYINYFDKSVGIPIIILEWIYSRLTICFILSSFIIIFCKHIKQIKDLIKQITTNEIDLENSYCLSTLIQNITSLRNSVENSIEFYNTLLSFITITGGISFAIFFRQHYVHFDKTHTIIFQPHEYYIIQGYSLYLIYQSIFFYIVTRYSYFRNELGNLIQGPSFVNRFLTRWTTTKMSRKCRDSNVIKQYNKMILIIEQENATSIDWMILEKLCSYTWMDFSILGISSQDGSLIKKVLAFSSIIYIILSYT